MAQKIRHFFVNIICGFVYGHARRRHVRTVLNSNIGAHLKFIRKNMNAPLRKIKTFSGFMGRNLVISVNNKYVFKFPLDAQQGRHKALREKRIVDAFEKISGVYVPPVELLPYKINGVDTFVRKYEYISGRTIPQLPSEFVINNSDTMARQLAQIIYNISTSDPSEIRDLKPDANATPDFMVGWSQGDWCDNFFIDEKTGKIIALFDWEDSKFGNFAPMFHHYKTEPYITLMQKTQAEYTALYNKHNKKKS